MNMENPNLLSPILKPLHPKYIPPPFSLYQSENLEEIDEFSLKDAENRFFRLGNENKIIREKTGLLIIDFMAKKRKNEAN